MTLDRVRRFALSLPEAVEAPHFHRTSFRVRHKIFATATPDGAYLHVFVTEEQRVASLAQHPDFSEELRWGKKVCGLRVLLPRAQPKVVDTWLAQAWANKAPRRLRARGSLGAPGNKV